MNNLKTEQYYKQNILDLMTQVENKFGKMFHELDPELEREVFMTFDNDNDKSGLIYLNNKIAKLLDGAQ